MHRTVSRRQFQIDYQLSISSQTVIDNFTLPKSEMEHNLDLTMTLLNDIRQQFNIRFKAIVAYALIFFAIILLSSCKTTKAGLEDRGYTCVENGEGGWICTKGENAYLCQQKKDIDPKVVLVTK